MQWFFFGSLQDLDVLDIVLGRRLAVEQLQPAILPGHRRVTVVGESYPALQPAADSQVEGVFVAALNEEDSRRICFFEGDEFALESRTVTLHSGETVDAMAFIADHSLPLADWEWDLATWQRKEKADFLPLTAEWMASYGKMTFQEADEIWKAGLDRIDQQRRNS